MADILVTWNPALAAGDWSIAAGGIAASQTGADDLRTAVLVSLFTDRVAPAGYVGPNGDTDPRGWWGDSYEASPIGSRLWMLSRAKKTDNTTILAQAKGYCLEALQWLIEDGIAASIVVNTFWFTPRALGITVSIAKPSGQTNGYSWTWNGFS